MRCDSAPALEFQLAASVPLALAIGPILAFTVGRWLSLTAVLGVYAGLSAYALYLLARAVKKTSFNSTDKKLLVFLGLIAIWLVIALVSLADIRSGGGSTSPPSLSTMPSGPSLRRRSPPTVSRRKTPSLIPGTWLRFGITISG